MTFSLRPAVIVASALQWALVTPAAAQNAVVPENTLKAAYLYHFIQFTEWPAYALDRSNSFNICISKTHPLRPMVSDLAGQVAHDKPIAVLAYNADNPQTCHVIILNAGESPGPVAQSPILTIADEPAEPGTAVIVLRVEQRRIGFSIDRGLAEKSGLQISSKLLRLARSVQ
jgi:hypothetical protein